MIVRYDGRLDCGELSCRWYDVVEEFERRAWYSAGIGWNGLGLQQITTEIIRVRAAVRGGLFVFVLMRRRCGMHGRFGCVCINAECTERQRE